MLPMPVVSFQIVQPPLDAQVLRAVQGGFFWGDAAAIEHAFTEHENGPSTGILGYQAGRLIGLVIIRWEAHYPPFRAQGIPLIQHIEIRYEERGRGLGGAMLARAEQEIAQRSAIAGLCVGIFDSYGPAQRLYARRGFVPDGRGVCQGHRPLTQGERVVVHHDLLLWLVKDVSRL